MSDEGYTLVETLTALAIVSLAISGLAAGVQVLGRQQAKVSRVVADTEAVRSVQAALDRLIADRGPFRSHQSERFAGDSRAFRFDCDEPAPCAAILVENEHGAAVRIEADGRSRLMPLRIAGPLSFRYEGALGASAAWPPERVERQALRSLSVVRDDNAAGTALIKARVWSEQPVDCQFDVILQDCR